MNNIKTKYVNYKSVIEQIGENKICERLCAVHDIYQSFLEQTNYKDKIDIILNDRVLMHAILDYFTDITRLKEFHSIDMVSHDKIIAYEISWLLKRKPIQILDFNKEELVYVNEKFLLQILVNHLTDGKIIDLNPNSVLGSYCNYLYYYLKYRDCDAKVLELVISSYKAGRASQTF